MTRFSSRAALALVAFLATASPAVAQSLSAEEIAKIDKLVTEQLDKTGTPSASLAVVRGGQLVWAKAYGTAGPGLPATASLPYQIASNSKQFIGMAILMLANENKLSLDDRVSAYFPDVTSAGDITIRQLLSHTSGLSDYWPHDLTLKAMTKPVTPQGIIDRWAKAPLDYLPGEDWQYSNTGYVVAGQIIEKVSGQGLMEFLDEHIFTPLGMDSAMSQDDAIGPQYPSGYGRAALGPMRVEEPAGRGWLYSAGELSMTASDLARWNVARINRELVPAKDWEAQEMPIRLNDGENTNYGLGVYAGDWNGHYRIAHGGESVGFLSSNYVFPEDKVAVTVMTNTWSSGAYGAIASGVSKIVLPPADEDPMVEVRAKNVDAAYRMLVRGDWDAQYFTPDGAFYFNDQRRADYADTLGPLGDPKSIEAVGKPRLRGGLVIQGYKADYGERTLHISTMIAKDGRIEQFLVSE